MTITGLIILLAIIVALAATKSYNERTREKISKIHEAYESALKDGNKEDAVRLGRDYYAIKKRSLSGKRDNEIELLIMNDLKANNL